MKEYKYKMSVIMAVYKVEQFLREAIDSVINQTIGFENIQLILVDDGSPDGCPAICDEYAAKYPDNIVVIHKENGGVSSARNEGLKHVEGQFVNFLDSDDKLGKKSAQRIYRFFMKHLDQVDVVAFPMKFFDAKEGEHVLNYKFRRGSRVIDLDKEWDNPQLSTSSAFIKTDCLEDLFFDTRLAYAEDAHLLQKVLSKKCAMGVVHNATYWYRRRNDGERSAVQSSKGNPKWYLPYMEFFQIDTINYFLSKFGYVPKFVQNTLMYHLQWRFLDSGIPEGVMSQEEVDKYFQFLKVALKYIDDTVIMAQRNIYREHKNFVLEMKHEGSFIKYDNDVVLHYPGGAYFKLSESIAKLEFIETSENTFKLEGTLFLIRSFFDNSEIFLEIGDQKHQCDVFESNSRTFSIEHEIQSAYCFSSTVPIDVDKTSKIRIIVRLQGVDTVIRNIRFGTFFPLSLKYKNVYAVNGEWVIRRAAAGIKISHISNSNITKLRKKYFAEIKSENGGMSRKIFAIRRVADLLLRLKRRPLWLISDRIVKAGDNGEAFFRYIKKNHREINTVFVLDKASPDYYKMKKIGKVVSPNSFKYRVLNLISDYIISSQAEVDIYNPFRDMNQAFKDMVYLNKFIFLQHGVTKDDLSLWLGRRNKNIIGFIAAAKPEYLSIVNGDYEYTEKEVWKTGFPRFDRLYEKSENLITIMPTWRKYIMDSYNAQTGEWTINEDFKNSEFLKFYNNLLNSEKLLEALSKHGYKLAFCPHPNLHPHLDLFKGNSKVEFLGKETEYRDIYAKSRLLVTDYSSAVFDFSYLKKPIIYTQFDKEEFFAGEHTYTKGYFEYERDGFGEVEYDLESTIDRIIEYMENGCQLKDKYRERIDNFFLYDDQNNCQRVYEKIIELDKNN